MQYLIDFFSTIVNWFFALCLALVNTLVAMLQDLLAWCFDQILAVVVYVLELIDFDFLSSDVFQESLGSLPAQVWNVFWLLGFPYAMALVAASIGIRLVLQLIPFTRLGS